MKKLIATIALCAGVSGAFGQGVVNFLNSAATATTLNGTTNQTTGVAGSWYFGLFIAPMVDVGVPQASFDPRNLGAWSFSGRYATNLASAGRLNGGTTVAVTGWDAGSTMSYAVAGWSSNLGHDWNVVIGGLPTAATGYFGQSAIGWAAAGGSLPGGGSLPTWQLFNSAGQSAQGLPLLTGVVLNSVPEPSTFALAGIGAAAMLIFRRRK